MTDLMPLELEYDDLATTLDIDALVARGRRARRRRQVAIGAVSVITAAAVGTGVGVAATRPTGNPQNASIKTADSASPAPEPSTRLSQQRDRQRFEARLGMSSTLFADNPPAGPVETLATGGSGWRAIAYLDASGGLCEGGVYPAGNVSPVDLNEVVGSCYAAGSAIGTGTRWAQALPSGTSPFVTFLDEGAGMGTSARDGGAALFGLVRGDVTSVTVTRPDGVDVPATLSHTATSDGMRAWYLSADDLLAGFPHHGAITIAGTATWPVTALDGAGTVIATASYDAPG